MDRKKIVELAKENNRWIRQGEFNKALKYQIALYEMSNDKFGENEELTIDLKATLAEIFRLTGEYKISLGMNFEILKKKLELQFISKESIADTLNNIGAGFLDIGDYNNAEQYYLKCLELDREIHGEVNRKTAISYNNIGNLHKVKGDYVLARNYFRKALSIWEKVLGENHLETTFGMVNLAEVEHFLTNLKDSEKLLSKGIKILKEQLGEFHIRTISARLSQIGNIIHKRKGDWKEIEKELLNLENIITSQKQERELLAQIYLSLGSVYRINKQFEKAENYFQKRLNYFVNSSVNQDSIKVIYTKLMLIDNHISQNHIEKAERLLNTINRDSITSIETNKKIIKTLIVISVKTNQKIYFQEAIQKIDSAIKYEIESVFTQIDSYSRTLLSREWNGVLSMTLSAILFFEDNDLLTKSINVIFNCKNFVEQIEFFIQREINTTKNQELLTLRNELRTVNAILNEGYHPNPSSNTLTKLNPLELSNLFDRQKALESEILKFIDFRKLYIDNFIEQIELNNNSLFVYYIKFNHIFIDREEKGVWKDIESMDILFNGGSNNQLVNMAFEHYLAIFYDPKNMIFRISDIGRSDYVYSTLYDYLILNGVSSGKLKFWNKEKIDREKAIKATIKLFHNHLSIFYNDKKHIVVCPDGHFRDIPLQIVPLNNKKFLIDDFIISYVHTPNDLFAEKINPQSYKYTDPVICGAPVYSLVDQLSPELNEDFLTKLNNLVGFPEGKFMSTLFFKDLENLLPEIEEIAKIYDINALKGEKCNKNKIEKINSPIVFHIATHGYFSDITFKTVIGEELYREGASIFGGYNINPLSRCGLALSGANWRALKIKPPSECGNGIITAEEVMTINFENTKVAVLSACETGLGEDNQSFIRSFRLAGASTVISSLWHVPDKETMKIMIRFHQEVKSKNNVHSALRLAQLALKEKYSNFPKYWGGFVSYGKINTIVNYD